MGAFRFLWILACLSVALRLACDVTAGKLIAVAGHSVSVSLLYFPLTYILADVVTEVYGFARARAILWVTAGCSLLAGALYQIAALAPPAAVFAQDAAYAEVLGAVPRILLAGWIAVLVGDFANNYVLARMKLRTRGRFLWARLIGSTIVGQALDTALFYAIAFAGIVPAEALLGAMALNFGLKVAFETVLSPLTVVVCRAAKRAEDVDAFDDARDFTPFALGPAEDAKRRTR